VPGASNRQDTDERGADARQSGTMSRGKETRILVVDEFESMRGIIRQILFESGFRNIVVADDGVTALPLLRAGDIGLMITERNMPRMDGLALVRAVRADPGLRHLAVLMLTTEAKRGQIVEAVEAGVSDYLLKPFSPEALLAKVDKLAGGAGRGAART